jgi:hypothetical protein
MFEALKSKIFKRNKGDVAVEKRKAKTLGEKFDSYTEAITFAEAGLQDTARELMAAEEVEKAKVLVVGNEDAFSNAVVDYAEGLAERMGYEIIALSVNPVPANSSKLLGPYGDQLREEFKSRCEQGVARFRTVCQDKGIAFTHQVKLGDVDECIKEIHQEMRRVEFVITEPESCPEDGKVAIPVFCMSS